MLNVKGGLLISIIAATIVGIPLGVTPLPTSWNFGLDFSAFAAPFQTIPGTDTMAIVQVFLQPALLLFVFSLLMSDFFDTDGPRLLPLASVASSPTKMATLTTFNPFSWSTPRPLR